MIEWVTVFSLILFGVALVVAEIIFVPGTTVVGIVGFIFLIAGIAFGFKYFGSETGWVLVGVSAVISGLVFYFSFKTNVWARFALKTSIDSKFNEGLTEGVKIGAEGKAISALRPVGKAEIENKQYEVKTSGEYLDSGSKIKVVKLLGNQIFVESLN